MGMRRSWFAAVFSGVVAFLHFSSQSNAVTIFSDFGPGDSYADSIGYVVSTASSSQGTTNSPAMGFTSAIDADVTQIDIAVENATGTNTGTIITLYTANGIGLGSPVKS